MKPNVLNPPLLQNHINSEFFLLKAETWKDAYILHENVNVILQLGSNLCLTSNFYYSRSQTINLATTAKVQVFE